MADGDIAGQCRLLAGAPAFAAQGVLAVLAFSSLVLKRWVRAITRPGQESSDRKLGPEWWRRQVHPCS